MPLPSVVHISRAGPHQPYETTMRLQYASWAGTLASKRALLSNARRYIDIRTGCAEVDPIIFARWQDRIPKLEAYIEAIETFLDAINEDLIHGTRKSHDHPFPKLENYT